MGQNQHHQKPRPKHWSKKGPQIANNLVYGQQPVNEFIKKHPQKVKQIWTQHPDEWIKAVKDLKLRIVVNAADGQELARLVGKEANHQGIVIEVPEFQYYPAPDLWKSAIKRDKDLILVLDQIHDPQNFGAIIRSACLFGVTNIVVLNRHQAEVTPIVVKTSAGTAFDLQITKVPNLSQALLTFKEMGYWVYASNLNESAQDIREVKFAPKAVLVVGNEGEGIRSLLTRNSDFNVFIPIKPVIDSLNVSVATGIMLYTISSQIGLV